MREGPLTRRGTLVGAVLAAVLLATGGMARAQAPEETVAPPLVPTPLASPDAPTASSPRTLPWEEGDAVPPGYRLVGQIRTGLVVAGAATLGGVWLLNALVASIGIDIGQGQAVPLYIPVVGPFIAMGTFKSLQAVDAFFLALDGLVQAGAATMLIVGLAVPTYQLVRMRYASLAVPMPMSFGPGSMGLVFSGTL